MDDDNLSTGDKHPFILDIVVGGDLASPDTIGEESPDNPDRRGLVAACLAICDHR